MNAIAFRFVGHGWYEPVELSVRFVTGSVEPIGNFSVSKQQLEPAARSSGMPFDARANLASVVSNVRSGIVSAEILTAAEAALQRSAQPLDTATWSVELARELASLTD